MEGILKLFASRKGAQYLITQGLIVYLAYRLGTDSETLVAILGANGIGHSIGQGMADRTTGGSGRQGMKPTIASMGAGASGAAGLLIAAFLSLAVMSPGCKTVTNEDGTEEVVLDLEVVQSELAIFEAQIDSLIAVKASNVELVEDLSTIRDTLTSVRVAIGKHAEGETDVLRVAARAAAEQVRVRVIEKWLAESDDIGETLAAFGLHGLLLRVEAYV